MIQVFKVVNDDLAIAPLPLLPSMRQSRWLMKGARKYSTFLQMLMTLKMKTNGAPFM